MSSVCKVDDRRILYYLDDFVLALIFQGAKRRISTRRSTHPEDVLMLSRSFITQRLLTCLGQWPRNRRELKVSSIRMAWVRKRRILVVPWHSGTSPLISKLLPLADMGISSTGLPACSGRFRGPQFRKSPRLPQCAGVLGPHGYPTMPGFHHPTAGLAELIRGLFFVGSSI